jgi:hypothetical protein
MSLLTRESPVLQHLLSSAPEWEVEVRPDEFTSYDCDVVLQGLLRGTRLRPLTLIVEGPVLGREPDTFDDERVDALLFGEDATALSELDLALADTLDAAVDDSLFAGWRWVHEVRLVVSAEHGAWILAWGDTRNLRRACEELVEWEALLTRRLVAECGWRRDELPLGAAIVVTHHTHDEVRVPRGFERVPLLCRDALPRLASRFATLPEGLPEPAVALRLVDDLLSLGEVTAHEGWSDFPPELPGWMVRERDAAP